MEHEFKTLGQLKNFINSLNEDELKQPVRFWGEETGGIITSANILSEDYINPSGEGCEPVSIYKEEPDFEELYQDEPVVITKGSIIFNVNVFPGTRQFFDKCPTCQAPVNKKTELEDPLNCGIIVPIEKFEYIGK